MKEPHWDIIRVEELRLTLGQDQAIAELLAKSFSVDFEGRSFFQNRQHCRFLVYESNDLVGHLAIAYRAIQLGDKQVDIIGIGEVAVAKKARGRGIGSALIQGALSEGKKARADFALLFGGQSIYGAAGFVPAPNKIKLIEMEGACTKQVIEENNPHLMVLPLENKEGAKKQWDATLPVDLAGFAF